MGGGQMRRAGFRVGAPSKVKVTLFRRHCFLFVVRPPTLSLLLFVLLLVPGALLLSPPAGGLTCPLVFTRTP